MLRKVGSKINFAIRFFVRVDRDGVMVSPRVVGSGALATSMCNSLVRRFTNELTGNGRRGGGTTDAFLILSLLKVGTA